MPVPRTMSRAMTGATRRGGIFSVSGLGERAGQTLVRRGDRQPSRLRHAWLQIVADRGSARNCHATAGLAGSGGEVSAFNGAHRLDHDLIFRYTSKYEDDHSPAA